MDVTLYSIHKKEDGSGDVYYVPAIYFDTLKVSTLEQTGENVWAQGGQGNARLINWDYNKTINVSLEDALCTPASLGLCYGGILSSDWKNGKLEFDNGVTEGTSNRLSRFESAIYPRASLNPNDNLVCKKLPQSNKNRRETEQQDYLITSDVVDGTRIQGVGSVLDKSYRWRIIIESRVRSIAQVPDRFFDVTGRAYPIDWNSKVSVFNGEAPTYSNFKDAIIYKIGPGATPNELKPFIIFDAFQTEGGTSVETSSFMDYLTEYEANLSPLDDEPLVRTVNEDNNTAYQIPPENSDEEKSIAECDYLAIVVDNKDNYLAFVGQKTEENNETTVIWYTPSVAVNINQFKGLDMWIKFDGINEMIYFLLTKYERDIMEIKTSHMTQPAEDTTAVVNDGTTIMAERDEDDEKQNDGKLWCYINPRTMKPYLDDYWFHQNEPYYIKSLTIAQEGKNLNSKKIVVKADTWPGMYMLVGQTFIRNRDTSNDECLQVVIPQAKVKCDQTLTLQPDGDPTVFNMSLEVAQPKSKVMMEINTYKTKLKMEEENGVFVAVDGSSEILMQ